MDLETEVKVEEVETVEVDMEAAVAAKVETEVKVEEAETVEVDMEAAVAEKVDEAKAEAVVKEDLAQAVVADQELLVNHSIKILN